MNSGLIEHMQAFVAIAQSGSLTGAAIATGIGQATLSRQLSTLEQHLGCRLLHRSTRAIRLTEQGERLLPQALQLMALSETVQQTVRDSSQALRGRLRVACSHGFARHLLIPALPRWQRMHPDVLIELSLSDQQARVIDDGIDIAFRLAPLKINNLIARPLGASPRLLVASAVYLSQRPAIRTPQDLAAHACLLFAGMAQPERWQFGLAPQQTEVVVQGALSCSTVDALYDAVLANLGVAITPAWFWRQELASGQVVALLPEVPLPPATVHAVCPSRPDPDGKAARFIHFVESLLPQATPAPAQQGRRCLSALPV